MARILVIEDNAPMLTWLQETLELDGHEVLTAGSGPAGVSEAASSAVDGIILDVMLPGFDGFRALRQIREGGSDTPVLILTGRGEEKNKVRGLRLGADDYITKPIGVDELLARVEALLRRRARAPDLPDAGPASGTIRFGDVTVDAASRQLWRNGAPVSLRPREWDLLLALIEREGRVTSRQELLRHVWGYVDDVSSRTVDINIGELRRKLELQPAAPKHIITVSKSGYRFQSCGDSAGP